MGRQFGGASSDIVQSALTNEPAQASYFIWAYRIGNGGGAGGRMFNKGDAVGGNSSINFSNNNVGNTYDFGHQFSSTNGAWTVPRPNANEWHNFFIGYDNGATTNDPIIDQDGTPQTVTEATTPVGTFTATETQKYNIGNRGNDSARNWDGYLAEFAIWNRILSAGERAALGKGLSPLCISNGLVEYIPLIRDIISLKRGAPTVSGTTVIAHPRVIYSFAPLVPADVVVA